jgi:hypothetical protein
LRDEILVQELIRGAIELAVVAGSPALIPFRSTKFRRRRDYIRGELHARVARCFKEGRGKRSGHWPFQYRRPGFAESVFASARELNVPVLVGASEGEREFLGVCQFAALVRSLREEFDFPIFLNPDHTHSLEKALEAANSGFDAVVFDLSALPFEQNFRQTRAAVEALKGINPDILVEGELPWSCDSRPGFRARRFQGCAALPQRPGDIGSGSEIHARAEPDIQAYDPAGSEAVR